MMFLFIKRCHLDVISHFLFHRCAVYNLLESANIEMPRYAILLRDNNGIPIDTDFVELEDSIQIGDIVFQKPFVEKPIDAEDHNVFIYFPSSAGGGSQRLFRKVGSRSSIYSAESSVRKYGSYIYEDFVHTDGTDVKVTLLVTINHNNLFLGLVQFLYAWETDHDITKC